MVLVVGTGGTVSKFIRKNYPKEEAERLIIRMERDGHRVILPAVPVDKSYLEDVEMRSKKIFEIQAWHYILLLIAFIFYGILPHRG